MALVDGGFSIADAVATATSVAAQACGVADLTGRLAPGLAADVLVIDGDLEHDIRSLKRPAHLLMRGTAITLEG
jgi:imidazolonepropionase-like amidohydrolase